MEMETETVMQFVGIAMQFVGIVMLFVGISNERQCKEHIKQKENRKFNAKPTNLHRFINL